MKLKCDVCGATCQANNPEAVGMPHLGRIGIDGCPGHYRAEPERESGETGITAVSKTASPGSTPGSPDISHAEIAEWRKLYDEIVQAETDSTRNMTNMRDVLFDAFHLLLDEVERLRAIKEALTTWRALPGKSFLKPVEMFDTLDACIAGRKPYEPRH